MKASPYALCVYPDLPLARSAVPRGAGVVPSVKAQRVVESEEGVTLHRQAEVATASTVRNPQIDGTRLVWHWRHVVDECVITYKCYKNVYYIG